MQRDRVDVISSLERKGFQKDGGDHEYFIYFNTDGKKTMKKTKVSRGSSYKNIGDDLLGKMSKQVGLTKKLFLDLVDCSLTRSQYESYVFHKRPLKTRFAASCTVRASSRRLARVDEGDDVLHAPQPVGDPAAIAGDIRSVLCCRTKLYQTA